MTKLDLQGGLGPEIGELPIHYDVADLRSPKLRELQLDVYTAV